MISRPLTPPCIPFGTRRFFSFHILLDNSQTWTCIPIWLLFFSKKFGSALVPFSSNLFYYMLVLSPSSVPYPMLLAFGILFLFSSIVSNRLLGFSVLPIHLFFLEVLSYLQVCSIAPILARTPDTPFLVFYCLFLCSGLSIPGFYFFILTTDFACTLSLHFPLYL